MNWKLLTTYKSNVCKSHFSKPSCACGVLIGYDNHLLALDKRVTQTDNNYTFLAMATTIRHLHIRIIIITKSYIISNNSYNYGNNLENAHHSDIQTCLSFF